MHSCTETTTETMELQTTASELSDEVLRFSLSTLAGEVLWTCPANLTQDWGLLQSLREDCDDFDGQEIPLFSEACAGVDTMNLVAEYAKRHLAHGEELDTRSRRSLHDWEWEFFGDVRRAKPVCKLVEAREIARRVQRIAAAAMFLNYQELTTACERACAGIMRHSTELTCPEAPNVESVIRFVFELVDDFSPEERAEVERERRWTEELETLATERSGP
jgi:hypothetical protein